MTTRTISVPERPAWTLLRNAAVYNTSLVGLVFTNADSAFQCMQRLLSVNCAADLEDAVVKNVRDRFEVFSEQLEELSAFMWLGAEDTRLSFWE